MTTHPQPRASLALRSSELFRSSSESQQHHLQPQSSASSFSVTPDDQFTCFDSDAIYSNVSFPNLRTSGNPLLFTKISTFILTGSCSMEREIIYDIDGFQYELLLLHNESESSSSSFSSSIMIPKRMSLSEESQAEEQQGVIRSAQVILKVRSSRFSSSQHYTLLEHTCALPTGAKFFHFERTDDEMIDDTESLSGFPAASLSQASQQSSSSELGSMVLCVYQDVTEMLGEFSKAVSIARLFANIRHYVVCSSLFTKIRRAVYSNKFINTQHEHIDEHRQIWILRSQELIMRIVVSDTRLSTEQLQLLESATQKANLCLSRMTSGISGLSSALATLKELGRSVGTRLNLEYSTLPPAELCEWAATSNRRLASANTYFAFNIVEPRRLSDVNLLSITKTATGIREFLGKAIRHRRIMRIFEIRQVASHLLHLSLVDEN